MAYDPGMAARIRAFFEHTPQVVERKMFGGVGWTIGGHMAAGAHSDGRLMVRCGKADFPGHLAQPGVDAVRRGGKPLTGWLLVDAEVVAEDAALARWLGVGQAHAQGQPPK